MRSVKTLLAGKDLDALLGWTVSGILVVISILRPGTVHPVLFGLGYYAFYVLRHGAAPADFIHRHRQTALALLCLGLVAVVYADQSGNAGYWRRYEQVCGGADLEYGAQAQQVCRRLAVQSIEPQGSSLD